MASAVENFIFNELPRRLVVDSSLPTGSSLTAGWVLVASGVGFQAIPADPSLLGFEPTVAPATSDPTTKYYRGDKTWQTLNATAVGAIASSEKGIALGVATLDADGYVLVSQMNPSVIERVVIVADQAARYALTTLDVQNGDVVNQQSPLPSTMWFVVDQDNLGNSGGYLPFSAGTAGSVAWSGVTGKPAIIGDLEEISLTTEGDLIQFVSGNWIKVNAATLKTSLSIQTSDVSGLDTALGALQSSSDNLTAVTGLATNGIMVMTNAGTATAEVQAREITVSAPLEVTNGTGVDDNPSISLGESEVTAGIYGDDLNYATFEVTSKGLLSDAVVRSIERPSLIIPNATVDYYLSNRTRHILGVAGTYGALSLILPAGDTLQSGSWVEIIVNEDLVEFTDSVTISATGIQSVNNVSSINLVSYGLYPGSRIYCVYEHLSSEWVVTVNNNNTFRSLTVVNPASTDFNESHLIESAALQPRTVLLPDADVDLTKVSQAASTSTDGYLTATDWNAFSSTEFIDSTLRIIDDVDATKKAAFDVSGIATDNIRTITVPNANVDLGKVSQAASASKDGYLTSTDWNAFNSPEFVDSTFRVKDNTDATKKLAFEVSGVATGTTRTITMPNVNINLGHQLISASYSTSTGLVTFTKADGTNTSIDMSNVRRYVDLPIGVVPAQPNVSTLFKLNSSITINIDDLSHKTWEFEADLDRTVTLTKTGNSHIVDREGNTLADSGTTSCIIAVSAFGAIKVTGLGGYFVVEYGSRRLYTNSGALGLVSKTGAGAGSTKYKTTFVRSSGTSFASDTTVTLPDANVDLGKVSQAASTSTDGYLTSTDWSTFNGKQAALGNVITANTYGSSTQYPVVTVNVKGIVTGITLQTVPTPTFTDATFVVQKNGSPSISATWSLTAFTVSHVHTYPDKDINFGDMSSVATTDGNTLGGTRNRILGGSSNTVSGTDNIVIGSDNLNISSSQAGLNARGMRHKVRGSTAITLPAGSLIDGMQSGTIGTSTFAGGCKITSYFKIDKAAGIQNVIVADSSAVKPLANIGKNELALASVAAHKLTITSAFATQAAEWLIVVRESELPVVLAKGGIGSYLPTITATASSAGSGDSILRELTITITSTGGAIANDIQWNVFLESYYTATETSA